LLSTFATMMLVLMTMGGSMPLFAEETELQLQVEETLRIQEIRYELRKWDQSVRGFRREHSMAVSAGPSSGKWHFKRFGSTVNKKYQSSGIFSKVQYSYHIPLHRSFGYLLGTSMGYIFEDNSDSGIDAANALMLPGLLLGLVYNFSPGFRIVSGADYYLERWSNLGERDDVDTENNPTISVTARALDFMTALDVFYDLKWAVRFEVHRREVNYYRPKDAEGKPVDAVISKSDQWLGVGLTYHLM
jgi:hypothetical protein